MAVRPIDGEALLKELTCDFTGTPFHGNKKVTIGEVRRIIESMPTLTPPNEPLTLDELREMNGEPVWVVPIVKCKWATRQWCVLAADEALIPGVDHWWWSFEGYGETWIAYRRPKEEQ